MSVRSSRRLKNAFRIGAVSYLNAQPLVYCLRRPYTLHTPSHLAEAMRRGELDVSILPISEVLDYPGGYEIILGIAIGCRGAVASVKLLCRVAPHKIQTLGLDANSRTSNDLARIILAHKYRIAPKIVSGSSRGKYLRDRSLDAQVLIGDDALFDGSDGIDLGAAWFECTRLPFVFAVWAVRKPVCGTTALANELLRAKTAGLQHLDEIAERSAFADKGRIRRYLRENVRYDLGAEERRAITLFGEYRRNANRASL
jgi:chorismate dehydratase